MITIMWSALTLVMAVVVCVINRYFLLIVSCSKNPLYDSVTSYCTEGIEKTWQNLPIFRCRPNRLVYR
jgi:hypothetical protein